MAAVDYTADRGLQAPPTLAFSGTRRVLSSFVALPLVGLPLFGLTGTVVLQRTDAGQPPGLVRLNGGRATIGTPSEWIEEMGRQNTTRFNSLCCQSPQHAMAIGSFYLMTTEVTNEQYLAFVLATGWRPPSSWGSPSIANASRKLGEELARQREQGVGGPEHRSFDPESWWTENWRTSEWAIPEGEETRPVVYVDFADASAYARWAGLRLPTEFEFQYAGRGKGREDYPWGEKWDPLRCANQELQGSSALAVGSFPGGSTKSGLHDLIGNVWEWTSSPFTAYPNYKALQIEIRERGQTRIIEAIPEWDADSRVAMGGSWQNEQLACRLPTRRSTVRSQRTDSLGFRCAASIQPGFDLASSVLSEDLPPDKRPSGVRYAPELVVAADRWRSRPGTAQTSRGEQRVPIERYAIIESYDCLLFFPVHEVDLAAVKDLRHRSLDAGPVQMGVYASTKPSIAPALEAGTYLVAFRGGGAGQGREPGRRPDHPEGMDLAADNLIFYDPDMRPVSYLPLLHIEAGRPTHVGVDFAGSPQGDEKRTAKEGAALEAAPAPGQPVQTVRFQLAVRTRVSNLAFLFELPIQFEREVLGSDWRH
jgi:formylglycine-generating enzyme required for sulfatase activity